MLWPKNVLKCVEILYFSVFNRRSRSKYKDKDLFSDSKTNLPISKSAAWAHCLVKPLYAFFRMHRVFSNRLKFISKVFYGCFKEVSRKLTRCLQKSFMLHGTHRSLPSRRRACLRFYSN